MLSIGELREFAPQAAQDYLEALVGEKAALERAGLTTPLRIAHFLAQTAHETGGFSIVREATNWTAAQMCALWPARFKTTLDPRILACRGDAMKLANLAYSGRKDLGNVDDDDGWAYRGGGFLQLTGRAAYHEAGTALGVDLEGMPELIEDTAISLNVALYIWARGDLNKFADRNYGHTIGNAINRGNPFSEHDPIGAKAREQWFTRAWTLFGDGKLPAPGELALGARGPAVTHLQETLRMLGYAVGATDGVFGPTLARAVAAFKLEDKGATALEPAELVGPRTWAALEVGQPVVLSPERTQATAKELAAKGSTEVIAGQQGKAVGQLMLYGGVAEGARQTGILDQASGLLGSMSGLKSTVAPVVDAIQWGLKHAFWVVIIVGGVWFWVKGRQIISARLKAHQFGWNLWR